MASFKQHSTRRNPLISKMEVSKPKVGIGPSGLGGATRTLGGNRTAITRSFKVYSESETDDVKSRNGKSVPVSKPSTMASASFHKGVLKSTEPCKSKNYGSAKPVVERRALADVSNVNVNSISSRNLALRSLKPPLGTRTVNVSSRKSIQGNIRVGPNQGVSESNPSKKAGDKDLKAPADNQRSTATKLIRESTVANGRRTTRNSLIKTRKSLPVLKRVNQTDISKENSGSSEKGKGEIKVTVSKKVVPGLSNARTNLWRNRVSDGFIIMRQNNLDSRALSRKSIKTTVKIALKSSDPTRNKISNQKKGPNKSAMVATALPKNKQTVASSLCGNPMQESIHGRLPSDEYKPSTSDVTIKKSSRRRRSYTSILMEGSKLLEEQDDATKKENVASIDDEGNQLEVADYIDEIYQYYWTTEAHIPLMGNYMSIQTEITPHMRAVLINWLVEVHYKYDLMQETLYLMVTLLDQYLSQVTVKKNEIQLVGLTALLLASKYEDFWHPRVQDLLAISAESYTRDQMLGMEKLILKKLKFRLNTPTPYVFMLRFLKAAQSDMKLEHLAFYLIELCLVEYEALMFKPSLLCASAIYVARCTLQTTPWTPLLRRHARYEESQLRESAVMVLRFQKAASISQLKVTYDKYMSPDLSGVAAITPLDTLPL